MNKPASLLIAFVLAAIGAGQASQKAPNYGPDVKVPKSNLRQAGDEPSRRYTRYLRFTGAWRHSSIDDQPNPMALLTHGPAAVTSSPQGYHPSDIRTAYGMPIYGGQGAIAIIDAYSDPAILSDFNIFSAEFGLPTETSSNANASTNQVFQVVYATGTAPPFNVDWAGEISLDAEWAHAVAPNAKIYLVEASGTSDAELDAAVQVAETLPNVHEISMSFGSSGEYAGEQSEDSVYTAPNITYYGATGDEPGNKGYPAMSPNVVAVGGTSMTLLNGNVVSESVWNQAGCGPSTVVPRPSYQSSVSSIVGAFRGTPDICADADPDSGVAVYNSNDIGQSYNVGGWEIDGGTSLATPVCAAIANVRGSYSATSFAEHTRLYGQLGTSNIRDITSGSVVVSSSLTYKAGPGYDLASGLGESVNTYPTLTESLSPSTAATVSGALLGGTVSNLATIDGDCYVVASRISVGVGEVAGAQIAYSLSIPSGYTSISSVQLQVASAAVSGVQQQLEALNLQTGQYDVLASGALNSTVPVSPTTVSVSVAKYVSSSGLLTVKFVATRPESLGLSAFSYRIDQAAVTSTFSQ